MEIVGGVGSDVGRQSAYEVPRLLRTQRERGRRAQRIPGEEASNIHLAGGGTSQPIVAIAGIEMPLRTKVMVKASYAEIRSIGERHVAFETLLVEAVTTRTQQRAATRVIRKRHVLGPHLLDQRIDSDASRVACGGTS